MSSAEYVGYAVIFMSTAIFLLSLAVWMAERAWTMLRTRQGWWRIREALKFYDEHHREADEEK